MRRPLAAATACVALQPVGFAQEPTGGAAGPRTAFAQERTGGAPVPRTTYVRVGGRGDTASDAVLYEPAPGITPSRIALLFAHPGASNFNHASGREMARRGYRILLVTNEGDEPADQYGPSISAALKYLRGLPSVGNVVIVTHSGGGHHMTFYQNAAENGPTACAGPEKISPCRTDRVKGLEKADASGSARSHAWRVSPDELCRSGRGFSTPRERKADARHVHRGQRL